MENNNRKNGFTLMEVLVALVILSVGLLGTASLLGGTIRANHVSKNVSIASLLAQAKMEEMKAKGYSGLPTADTTTTENYNSISGYPNNKRVTKVVVDSPQTGMKSVSAEVYWGADRQPVILDMIVTR